jgi:hypothetical protein
MKRILDSGGVHRVAAIGLFALAAALLLSSTSQAASARFADSRWGFDPTTTSTLPGKTMDETNPLLAAGDPTVPPRPGDPVLDIGLSGSTDLCILFESSVCRPDIAGVTGPYAVLMSLTVSVLNPSAVDGPFVVLLTGMDDAYDASEVTIALDPTVPSDLDTSGVNFDFTGFTPFVTIRDETYDHAGSEFIYQYIGWDVSDGDTVTFRYDVSVAPGPRAPVALTANAVDLTVVPEPGTALLMALGLAGLAASGRPGRAARPVDGPAGIPRG